MKHILIAGAALIIVLTAVLIMTPKNATAPNPNENADFSGATSTRKGEESETINDDARVNPDAATDTGTAAGAPVTFTGTLEAIDTGCFADGVCSATVDGKVVVVLIGWNRDAVGQIIGVESIGDLETVIGKEVEVYAAPTDDGGFTLIGNTEYYIKVVE